MMGDVWQAEAKGGSADAHHFVDDSSDIEARVCDDVGLPSTTVMS